MRLKITKSKNSVSFYVIKDYMNGKKRTTKIVEKLGNINEVAAKAGDKDPYEWIREYINKLNELDKDENREISLNLSPVKIIPQNQQLTFNGGYLFLQRLYYDLGINNICKEISDKYKFTFDLNSILSRLIYSRIIYPSSKLKTFELSKNFIEQPDFELQHIYRALEVIAKEDDFIQSELYKNSLKLSKRNDKILYYDCTNYFFEIEQEDGLQQYGKSKQSRPNPIVQMGLFMDGDGIPLAFNITPGNTNEQVTLRPTEEKIIKDFRLSKFIVCTDAGLASTANRRFNNISNRSFITTQSIKKLKKFLMDWALANDGWHLIGNDKVFNIEQIQNDEKLKQQYYNKTFYKERWIKENDLEQRLIVTFSIKYREYQKSIRDDQISRARKLINTNPKKIGKTNQNNYNRLISRTSTTKEGEVADENHYSIDYNLIEKEAKFDGFYGVCTNLEDAVEEIIKINHRRWQIEECFRIMKTEFKARPVYLGNDERIKAHFTTCFLSLVIFRYLEKALEQKYTVSEIIECLKNYNFREILGDGYIPLYKSNNLTDDLHSKFNFKTNYEIVPNKKMKIICKETKK